MAKPRLSLSAGLLAVILRSEAQVSSTIVIVFRLAARQEEAGESGEKDGQGGVSFHESRLHFTAQRRAKSWSWPWLRPR